MWIRLHEPVELIDETSKIDLVSGQKGPKIGESCLPLTFAQKALPRNLCNTYGLML